MSRRGRFALLAVALLLALPAACISRVAPRDETIATGLAELQASHCRFFDQLQQTAGTPDSALECHLAWYDQTRAEIVALRTRAAAYGPRNRSTVSALELLEQSVVELEEAHARGLSAAEIPILRTLFDSQLRMLMHLEAAKKPAATEVSP